MAKLQQKMETTKQNSQILLIDGYVTMNGKRYDECVPFEREAFNEALHIVRGGKKRRLPVNVFTMTKENYTPSGKVSKAMFDCLVSKAHSIEDSNIDEFGIEAKHGVYKILVRGAWVLDKGTHRSTIQIVYNESYVLYKGECYDLQFSDEQIDVLTDLLNKEYDRLDKEAEEERSAEIMDELAHREERKSYNFIQYGFLNV